mgnify:CR=1 FL=1
MKFLFLVLQKDYKYLLQESKSHKANFYNADNMLLRVKGKNYFLLIELLLFIHRVGQADSDISQKNSRFNASADVIAELEDEEV